MTLYRGPGGTGSATSDADTTLYQEFLIQTQAARDAALQAETNAELAEVNAETAETNAETAATAAASSASAAASSASSASTSATNAASSASSASTSASNAASSASSASSSASAASTSATNAASSATAAASSASAASTSATNAANSATSASNSASTATTQATNAASSATAAASSATAAQSAQTAAEAARDAALSAYDNFDDRYLGPKASDPTLDNDGNALVTGALYFNTATNVMKVYDGSTWVAAYVSAAGVLLTVNNLSDLSNTATARANLNVPTRTGGDASGTWGINVTGNAATVTNGVYTTGDQTIAGTKTLSSNPILNAGTSNGVAYLNGSKVLTTGSALIFDGNNLGIGQTPTAYGATVRTVEANIAGASGYTLVSAATDNVKTEIASSEGSLLGQVGTRTNHPLVLKANNAERMRVTTAGDVGIGTSSPKTRLQSTASANLNAPSLGSATNAPFYLTNTDTSYGLLVGTSAADGRVWLQAQRTDGTATAYNITLNEAGGNVGIGTSSPSNFGGVNLQVQNSNIGSILWSNGTITGQLLASGSAEVTVGSRSNHPLRFGTNDTERARIDTNGRMLVGTTSGIANGTLCVRSNFNGAEACSFQGGSNNFIVTFHNTSGTLIGSITGSTGSTTSYNTSSDYRLKEDIQPMTGALAKVAALKPVTYKWKADGSDGQGFIAHELAEVCPDAVSGEKDAVNEDGSIKPQGIDTSFLVATLTAAIQEQQAIIDAQQAALNQLTARIEALEQA